MSYLKYNERIYETLECTSGVKHLKVDKELILHLKVLQDHKYL